MKRTLSISATIVLLAVAGRCTAEQTEGLHFGRYIMVNSVEATIEAVIARGGKIVQPIGGDAPQITARFRDPAGNVLGLNESPSFALEHEQHIAEEQSVEHVEDHAHT
jgi:hypothetical protein